MSIFDRFKDIANFLSTRPEARTPEQEKVGEDIEGAAKTAQDIAESRLEGVSDEEARGLSDLVRDFFSSDEKGIKEFRDKNKEQIAKDKKLVGNILGKTPVGAVRDFVVKQAVKNYGPQIAETASNFLKTFQPEEKRSDNQFEFYGTIYDLKDFFEAGRVNYDTGGYEIDKNRNRVSPIKAFVNLLPDDYSKSPAEVYNDFRQIKQKFPNTPFADFFSMAELKESGLEFALLDAMRADKERGGGLKVTKGTLLNDIGGEELDPFTKKVRYARDDTQKMSNKELFTKRLKELNDQFANLYDSTFLREGVLFDMQKDIDSLIEMTNQSFEGRDMSDEKYLELLTAANQNYQDMAARFRKEKAQKVFGMSYEDAAIQHAKNLEEQKNPIMQFSTTLLGPISRFNNFNRAFGILSQKINETLDIPETNEGLLDFMTGANAPSYRSTGPNNLKNYDVQAITIVPRTDSILGENTKDSTHFNNSWSGGQQMDAFHYRTGTLTDPKGVDYNVLVEVQSDQEGPIRKQNRYYDPALTIQSQNLAAEINDFTENNIPRLQELYKLNPNEIAKTIDLTGIMKDGDLFLSASSDQIKQEIDRLYGDEPARMIDNIPEANRENYLANNTRADEIFKYMKKLNKYVENQYRFKKIENENQPGRISKTIPYVSTGPLGYAEEAIYQYVLDSIRTGIDKVTWVPGEHAAQIQLGGDRVPRGDEFTNEETTLNALGNSSRAKGMFAFYGSIDNPKNNTMYKAANNVVGKLTKLGQQIYGDDFVPPKLYEQGAKTEEGQFYNTLDASTFATDRNYPDAYIPNNPEGWGFIDLTPTIEYLKDKNYDKPRVELDEGLLQNYVTRKRGGQIESPSLLSLDEVINGR